MLKEYPDVMTPEQVAAALCISRKSVYRLLHERTIGSKRVGAKYIIPKCCVEDYLISARYMVKNDNSRELSERKST